MASTSTHKNNKGITFGLIFFDSSDVSPSGDKYRLVIESAKFADRHNFSSVWIPERHFTREGWLYPNPVVLHAALARETQQIHLRAGSVVMPLHDPIRVAEEWAMVDNLSGGRVGISFASGWHPNDFVFFPDNYAQRNELMYQGIETVRKLWRGESIQVKGGDGKLVDVRTYPPPIQAELPFWVTAAGNPKTFAGAGKMGAHLLTHMYNQSVDELAEKIRVYRESLAEHGFDPQSRQVSVMVHTFVSFSQEAVLAQAGGPFRNYLRSAGHLLNAIAYSRGQKVDLASLSEQDVEDYLHFVFERLVSTQRVIFGTPESCLNLIKQLYAAGVNEVACQIDFGLDTDIALANMVYLNKLKDLANAELTGPDGPPESFVAARLITPKQEDQSSLTGRDQSRGYEAVARPAPSSNGNSTPAVSKLVSQRQDRLEDVQKRCREDVPVAAFYDRLHARGIELSSSFRGIEQLWRGDGEALGRVQLLDALADESQRYQVHPTLLDACLQVLIATLPDSLQNSDSALYLPTGLRSFKLHKRPGKRVWSHALLTTGAHAGSLEGDVRILDEDGQLLVEVQGIQLQRSDVGAGSSKPQEETQANELSEWLYELRWEANGTDAEPYRSKEGVGKWLIFADQGGVGRKLAELLAEQGETAFTVTAGERYQESGRGQYIVNPQHPDDVRRVIKSVLRMGAVPLRGVMHLWSLDATPEQQTTSASLERDQDLGVGHALSVIQGLISIEDMAPPRLWLVTRGAQSVEEQPATVAIAQSPLWGLGRTAAMEHPELWGGLVDLDADSAVAESAAQLLAVAGEDRDDSQEDQLAFRHGQRYVARMVRHTATTTTQPSVQVRADASYLITGGLWGLGLEVARWLAQKGARHLILAGRSRLPERAAWDSVEPGSRVAQQIAGVRELEALGVHVHYAALDVADEAQLTTFLDSYRRQGHPPIKGVMHAASVWQDQQGQSLVRPLVNLDADALKAVFRPKVWGAWLLHSLLKDAALDFFVSFSSGASLFGSAAQGNYAAAGSFLDALAHYQRAVGVPAISFDWGAVSEIGYGGTADGQRVHEYWEAHGIQRITPRHVLAALDLFIPQNVAQIGVLKLDWQLLREFFPQTVNLPLVSYLIAETGSKDEAGKSVTAEPAMQNGSGIVASILSASVGQRQGLMETYLSEQVAGVLRVPAARLDNEQPLTTLGLDSLMAIELKNRIELELKVRIPIVTFLQGPSITQFATQVLDQLSTSETSGVAESAAIVGAAGDGAVTVVEQGAQEKPRQNVEEVAILNEVKAEQLLGQLDQLSDAEVDALLSQMLQEDNDQATKAVSTDATSDGNGVTHDGNGKQVNAQEAEALLAQLDQLGDDEVNALLSQMVQEEELNR